MAKVIDKGNEIVYSVFTRVNLDGMQEEGKVPLKKRSTRRDVAELAGVSVATVSHVVNNGPKNVSAETRQRVLNAVKHLGYRVDAIARSLKTGSSRIIGLVIPNIGSPGQAIMASVVQEALIKQGYMMTMANSRNNYQVEASMLDMMISQSVDGLIIVPAGNMVHEELLLLQEQGVPLVFLDRYIPGFEADRVVTDNMKAAQRATEYLLRQGCRRILCVTFSDEASSAIGRLAGYRRGLEAAGIPAEEEEVLVVEDLLGSFAEAMVLSYIGRKGIPDGLFCTSQEIGISVVKALRRRGLEFPAENIVIFDAEWAELLNPPIPTVMQNFQELAETATHLLVDRLKNNKEMTFQTVYVDARLIVH